MLAAAAAAAAAPAGAQDGNVGRLFHTPQQRAELDKRRLAPAPVKEEAAPVVRDVQLTVNGYVSRSSGKTTTWMNGVPQYDTVRSSDPARIPVEAASGSQRVKVGATIDTNRGEVRDVIDGEIRVGAPKP
jgi:hypothetical protein